MYKISTDRVIIDHLKACEDGDAVVHVCLPNPVMSPRIREGVATSCDIRRRVVTVQFPNGEKEGYSFDCILIPEPQGAPSDTAKG